MKGKDKKNLWKRFVVISQKAADAVAQKQSKDKKTVTKVATA